MEGLYILIGFVQLIVLLLFFQIVRDVRVIRVKLASENPEVWLNKYHKNRILKRDADALYDLQEYVWLALNRNKSQKNYDNLKTQWEKNFVALNAEFPKYPFQMKPEKL